MTSTSMAGAGPGRHATTETARVQVLMEHRFFPDRLARLTDRLQSRKRPLTAIGISIR
ncbi:hypothetical protein ACIP2Y_38925 [Streptomyces sviceus]|uniref:hypothetical protein n=1 Tax=Streptomyces sviceus TaxID=285530 RepID=UPI0037F8EE3C